MIDNTLDHVIDAFQFQLRLRYSQKNFSWRLCNRCGFNTWHKTLEDGTLVCDVCTARTARQNPSRGHLQESESDEKAA